MTDILDLGGRTALVTGAGQGVGAEIARHLAEHGAGRVLVNDFYLERAEASAAAIGDVAQPLPFDVTDAAAVRAAVERAGPVDVLVNNAGNAGPTHDILDRIPFWESDPADWDPWLRVNLHGVLNAARAVLPAMVQRGDGRLVTVVSDAGRVGEAGLEVYSAAKAGAAGFTRAIAKAVGRHGITANCVALASMRTPATAEVAQDAAFVAKLLRGYAIRRLGEPSDAAALVLFLASPAASWITGQTYPVNGGYSSAL